MGVHSLSHRRRMAATHCCAKCALQSYCEEHADPRARLRKRIQKRAHSHLVCDASRAKNSRTPASRCAVPAQQQRPESPPPPPAATAGRLHPHLLRQPEHCTCAWCKAVEHGIVRLRRADDGEYLQGPEWIFSVDSTEAAQRILYMIAECESERAAQELLQEEQDALGRQREGQLSGSVPRQDAPACASEQGAKQRRRPSKRKSARSGLRSGQAPPVCPEPQPCPEVAKGGPPADGPAVPATHRQLCAALRRGGTDAAQYLFEASRSWAQLHGFVVEGEGGDGGSRVGDDQYEDTEVLDFARRLGVDDLLRVL